MEVSSLSKGLCSFRTNSESLPTKDKPKVISFYETSLATRDKMLSPTSLSFYLEVPIFALQRSFINLSSNSAITEEDYYDGDVYLCPPAEKPYGMQATLGIMEIYHKNLSRSMSITENSDVADYFHDTMRNSFCRHLGFPRAVEDSVYTLSALSEIYTFDHCPK